MASIGRVAVAAASVAQETTLALSNINFDFSLVRMEAPLEYRGLGAVLSNKRKQEAEDGSTHITARKLGALFSSDLPPIPNLTRAYGLRASEIIENPKFNPPSSPSHGPFVDYVGADGTSIWAAATSGPGAVAVHLLACLLARMWSGPEAISIWSELVATRKILLQRRLQEQEFPMSMVTASQIEIERHKLTEWDASARSWIRTADSAKKAQQTQVMLIIDNMDLPVPHQTSMYDDVMRAWTRALTVVENLVSGIAQRVNSGEALLGLSAWHIYPDICAIGERTTIIQQRDHVVAKGGVVTLGLQKHTDRDTLGISWSMPLAHLRFYGGAVPSQRTVGFKNIKVTFDHVVLVAIGSAMSTWNISDREMDGAMRFLIAFANVYDYARPHGTQRLLWPSVLADQAHQFLSVDQAKRQEMARLVGLGWRRFGVFIAPNNDHPPPFFGLTDPNECLQLLYLPDQAVITMRGMMKFIPINRQGAIIRHAHREVDGFRMIEYATNVRQAYSIATSQIDVRWITMPDSWWSEACISMVLARATYIKHTLGEFCGLLEPGELFSEIGDMSERNDYAPRVIASGTIKRLGFWEDLRIRCVEKPHQLECIKWLQRDHDEAIQTIEFNYREMKRESFLGNFDSRVHLYVLRQPGLDRSQVRLPIAFVTTALEDQIAACPHNLSHGDWPVLGYESAYNSMGYHSYYTSLAALAAAQQVFKRLPNAEVDLAVVSHSLSQAEWAQNMDLAPNVDFFMNVVAVSSSNNLYASEILFCDPSQSPSHHALRHVIGNVGRPGLVLLLCPRNTILREPDLESWEMVNHAPFDGKFEDNFGSTSLHLSLTGWEQPVSLRNQRDRDSVIHFVEAVVSAHDRGVWYADLDLLRLEERRWPRIFPTQCRHTESQMADVSLIADFTSVDN